MSAREHVDHVSSGIDLTCWRQWQHNIITAVVGMRRELGFEEHHVFLELMIMQIMNE